MNPGDQIGKYRIVAHLENDDTSELYEAVQTNLNQTIVLRVMTVEAAQQPELVKAFMMESRDRFVRRVTPRILDVGHTLDRRMYMILERA
jgi:hypothetical protein